MENINFYGQTMAHNNAGLVAGTTSSYTTGAATACSINGKWATPLAVQLNAASPTVDAQTGLAFVALTDNQATVLVWGVNRAGAIRLCQGSIVPTSVGLGAVAGAFLAAPDFPNLPDDFCAIGYQLVRTAPSASDFVPGASSWTATGITCSVIQNVSVLPSRPQTA